MFLHKFPASTVGQCAWKDGEESHAGCPEAACHNPAAWQDQEGEVTHHWLEQPSSQQLTAISWTVKLFLSAVPAGQGPHLAEPCWQELRL